MIPNDVQMMLLQPGRYIITNPGFGTTHGLFVYVDVDEDGACYQLDPNFQRDGMLLSDGWLPDTMVYVPKAGGVFVRISDTNDRVGPRGRVQ